MKKTLYFLIFCITIFSLHSCGQVIKNANSDFLLLKYTNDSYSYIDKKGKEIIPPDSYLMCFTDTFRNYAIVLDQEKGFIGIDRNQNILYKVFVFDNGPDYVSEGLFRILKDGKIGFASQKTGKIAIEPKYEAAYPFENGKAKVAHKASEKSEGEHFSWESDEWFFIDKNGNKLQK